MKKFLGILILTFTLTACIQKPYDPFILKKESHTFRVATHNINWEQDKGHAILHPEQTIAAIQAINPDIIGMQEVTEKWDQRFKHNLYHSYKYHIFRPYMNGSGFLILSKYPILKFKFIPSIIGWYPALLAMIKTPHGVIQFLDVHLLPSFTPHDTPGFPKYSFFKTASLRGKEISYFQSFLDPQIPSIILGDFNEGDFTCANFFLKNHRWIDAVWFDEGFTWWWNLKFLTLTGRHEHIYYHPWQLQLKQTQIVYQGDSDHYPVLADFN